MINEHSTFETRTRVDYLPEPSIKLQIEAQRGLCLLTQPFQPGISLERRLVQRRGPESIVWWWSARQRSFQLRLDVGLVDGSGGTCRNECDRGILIANMLGVYGVDQL